MRNDDRGLDRKVAIVTGAGRGLGLTTAEGYLRAGAQVAIFDRDRARLDAAGAELATEGHGQSVVVEYDTVRSRAQIRHALIGIARRRCRAGTGSSVTLLRSRTVHFEWPDPSEALQGVAWTVVGAVATRHYMAERQTAGLDIAVGQADADVARARLRDAGYTYLGELGKDVRRSIWRPATGQEVEVLEIDEEWWPDALREAQGNRDLAGLPILPLPYLVLMKLEASRAIDIADLSRMLGQADQPTLDRVRAAVTAWRSADLEDLENLIHLGMLELEGSTDP